MVAWSPLTSKKITLIQKYLEKFTFKLTYLLYELNNWNWIAFVAPFKIILYSHIKFYSIHGISTHTEKKEQTKSTNINYAVCYVIS